MAQRYDTVEVIRTDGYRESGIFMGSNYREHQGEVIGYSGVNFLRGTRIKYMPYIFPGICDDVVNNIFITEIIPARIVLFEKILERFER